MTYQELETICIEKPDLFKAAMQLCVAPNQAKAAADDETAHLAKDLSETPIDVIFAVIQREISPVKGDDDMIPFLNHYGDEDGVCPCCGALIDYEGDNAVDDSGTIVSWTCPKCGASGQSGYTGVFDGHYRVVDAAGNDIAGRNQ